MKNIFLTSILGLFLFISPAMSKQFVEGNTYNETLNVCNDREIIWDLAERLNQLDIPDPAEYEKIYTEELTGPISEGKCFIREFTFTVEENECTIDFYSPYLTKVTKSHVIRVSVEVNGEEYHLWSLSGTPINSEGSCER